MNTSCVNTGSSGNAPCGAVEGETPSLQSPAPDVVNWTPVCSLDALIPDVGVRALVGEEQVALFRLSGLGEVFAIDALDPFSKAPVLSRGIVGDLSGQLVVASPIFKQHFNLETGACLEDAAISVRTYQTRVVAGRVEIATSLGAGNALGSSQFSQSENCQSAPEGH